MEKELIRQALRTSLHRMARLECQMVVDLGKSFDKHTKMCISANRTGSVIHDTYLKSEIKAQQKELKRLRYDIASVSDVLNKL